MSERRDFGCGCAWIHAAYAWYQVVACPLHGMDMRPAAEPFVTPRKVPR